jgi:hypothetical protein
VCHVGRGRAMKIRRVVGGVQQFAVLVSLFAVTVSAQEGKQSRFTVGPRAVISITNHYGPITVKPSGNGQVVVTTVSHSDAISFMNEQHGNRIELRASSSRQGNTLADYTVLVPRNAFVSLRSYDGTLHAQGLRGDVILEAATATVEVTDMSVAHIHVKTLSGPINLSNIRNSHLDVHSVSGNVRLHEVIESSVEVNSGSGRIAYEGDPGTDGEYRLTSHSGDLEISIPASALVDINAHSMKGESDKEFPRPGGLPAVGQGNLLLKRGIVGTSRFVLRSFTGRIQLKRP